MTGRIRYAALARRGLLVRAHCGAPCTIDAALLLARALARTYGLASAPVVVGRARRQLTAAGDVTLRVKLSRKAKSHFRRRHPARLTLRLKVTEGGSTTTKTKRVKVT